MQEALTNVARHAGATRVEVRLKRVGKGICLLLKDNGRGLESANGNARQGTGLTGMRARARSLGGGLKVSSARTNGVTIEMWAP